jgi:uncharacterized membrane protein YfcA
VPQAAAIMLPLLAIMDALGLAAFIREFDRPLIRLLVPAALLGTLIGTALFGLLSAKTVAAVVGAITLVFVALRLVTPARDAKPPPRWLGFVLGATSGFTSFVAHAGGPPVAFYAVPLKLAPVRFAATMAVFFAVVNTSKWIPYAWLGLIDTRNMVTAAVLAPVAPIGVWLGVKFVRRVPEALFYRVFLVGMSATGIKLLWDGLR